MSRLDYISLEQALPVEEANPSYYQSLDKEQKVAAMEYYRKFKNSYNVSQRMRPIVSIVLPSILKRVLCNRENIKTQVLSSGQIAGIQLADDDNSRRYGVEWQPTFPYTLPIEYLNTEDFINTLHKAQEDIVSKIGKYEKLRVEAYKTNFLQIRSEWDIIPDMDVDRLEYRLAVYGVFTTYNNLQITDEQLARITRPTQGWYNPGSLNLEGLILSSRVNSEPSLGNDLHRIWDSTT